MSADKYVLPDFDAGALVACYAGDLAAGHDCNAVLYPCFAALGHEPGVALDGLPEATAHDLVACLMDSADGREDALIAVLPEATDYVPNSRVRDIRFRHHRVPRSDCGVSGDATLSDWRCEEDRIGRLLFEAVTTGGAQ
jgi:hypothetical protein